MAAGGQYCKLKEDEGMARLIRKEARK